MLPSASNITMPSAVVSRIAPSSSALAWPTGDGADAGGEAEALGSASAARSSRQHRGALRGARREDQRQRGIAVPGDRVAAAPRWPAAAHPAAGGARKSSPACRCPTCCWRWTRRARHRAHRGRRPPPAHAGWHSPSARETRGWRRAAGRADRSARRSAAGRAAPGRARCRRAAAARAAISQSGAASVGSVRFRRGRLLGRDFAGGSDDAAAMVSLSLSSRADNCRASSLKALFSTGVSDGDFAVARRAERQDVFGFPRRRFHGRFQIGLM